MDTRIKLVHYLTLFWCNCWANSHGKHPRMHEMILRRFQCYSCKLKPRIRLESRDKCMNQGYLLQAEGFAPLLIKLLNESMQKARIYNLTVAKIWTLAAFIFVPWGTLAFINTSSWVNMAILSFCRNLAYIFPRITSCLYWDQAVFGCIFFLSIFAPHGKKPKMHEFILQFQSW